MIGSMKWKNLFKDKKIISLKCIKNNAYLYFHMIIFYFDIFCILLHILGEKNFKN